MKKDYSEYQYSAYDKYRQVRSSRKNVDLTFFHNSVRFYPEERLFRIFVDRFNEQYAMRDFIDEYDEQQESRTGRKLKSFSSPEEAAEFEAQCWETEAENQALIEQMSRKYHINREEPDLDRVELHKSHSDLPIEPFINIFSGTNILLGYGEGLLDFIYADFLTPLKKELSFLNFFTSIRDKAHSSDSPKISETDTSQATDKVYNRTQEMVEAFYDYESTFSTIKDVAYASLYSAVCPPKFEGKFDITKELKWYGNYLLALQKEYLELIEVCFDENFYPGVLGGLHPSERFALYRSCKDLPTFSTRKETMSFSIRSMSGRTMPYGMSADELKHRITTETVPTPEHIALSEKLGVSVEALITHTRFPQFMNISYDFGAIADILELEFTKMLEQNVRFRKCKRCGRYFIMKGNYDTNYCDRVAEGESRNCQELAAAENYKAKIADDKAIPVYNRYYKRYAARVKVRQIKEADFKKWKYQAIAMRDDCSAGKITLEEYIRWMEDSFPNKKPKT